MIKSMDNSPTSSPQPTSQQPYAPPTPPPLSPQQPELSQTQQPEKHSRFDQFKPFATIVIFIAGIILAAALINQFIFQSYYVDGTSMTPTLQNNDRLIIDKVERTAAHLQGKPYIPERGQIIVLDSSLVDQVGHSEQLIKRVIGLPGERVVIGTDGVVRVVNTDNPGGFNVNESLGLDLQPTYVETPLDVTVPEGSVFVMGDNRGPGGSFDSRAFGPIASENIEGRLFARIFPFNNTEIY